MNKPPAVKSNFLLTQKLKAPRSGEMQLLPERVAGVKVAEQGSFI
jgi:hypothetical protein